MTFKCHSSSLVTTLFDSLDTISYLLSRYGVSIVLAYFRYQHFYEYTTGRRDCL